MLRYVHDRQGPAFGFSSRAPGQPKPSGQCTQGVVPDNILPHTVDAKGELLLKVACLLQDVSASVIPSGKRASSIVERQVTTVTAGAAQPAPTQTVLQVAEAAAKSLCYHHFPRVVGAMLLSTCDNVQHVSDHEALQSSVACSRHAYVQPDIYSHSVHVQISIFARRALQGSAPGKA